MKSRVHYLEKLGTVLGLVLLLVILSLSSPYFLTVANLMSVLRQGVALSLVAIGMSYAIISGGIDLSVGSIMALSGCTSALLMTNYGVNWFLACLIGVGIVMTSRLNSGQPIVGEAIELDAIASVVIGGTAMSGGQGGLFGTMIGVLVIIFLHNGLNILGVSAFWQKVAIGLVILVAVLIDQLRQRIRARSVRAEPEPAVSRGVQPE